MIVAPAPISAIRTGRFIPHPYLIRLVNFALPLRLEGFFFRGRLDALRPFHECVEVNCGHVRFNLAGEVFEFLRLSARVLLPIRHYCCPYIESHSAA